jgi:hypothetical protein
MLSDAIKTMLQDHSIPWYYTHRDDINHHTIQFVPSTHHFIHLRTGPLVELATIGKNYKTYFFNIDQTCKLGLV